MALKRPPPELPVRLPKTQRLEFKVPGIPVPQPRPRVTFAGGHARAYTPAKHPVRAYREAVQLFAKRAFSGMKTPAPTQDTAVSVSVIFYYQRNQRHDFMPKTTRPDLDNLMKAVLDAIVDTGILPDDGIVDSFSARKVWTSYPSCTNVNIWWEEP